MKTTTKIFLSLFLKIIAISCMAQTNSWFEDPEMPGWYIDPVPTYIPDHETLKKPLYLSNMIKKFDYKGRVVCTMLIDTLEKSIKQVTIYMIQISNGRDSVFIRIPEAIPISEYSGEYADIIHKMYPFIENHVLKLKLIRDKFGTPKRHGRFYKYGIVIQIL